MSDTEIEKEIQEKGLTAPRVLRLLTSRLTLQASITLRPMTGP